MARCGASDQEMAECDCPHPIICRDKGCAGRLPNPAREMWIALIATLIGVAVLGYFAGRGIAWMIAALFGLI